jgi:transposase
METIGKIRRRHKVKGESISAIARDLNLSRNTVKKYLNAEVDPVYQRERQPAPKLGALQPVLEAWLEQDSQRPKRERRTAQRLFEDLQREGYAGAYDSVQRLVKHWKTQRPGASQDAFVPLVFAAGDACQFDWSHEHVILGGVAQVVKLAHFRLSHSRQMFLAAYPRESQEMVFDAHNRAFAFFGGVPVRMIYDNPKTIVESIFSGKDRQFNRRFLALASHYLFEPVACTPASGWEKGQVENQVGNVREWLFTPILRFGTLAEMNAWLETRCTELAKRPHPTWKERPISEVFAEEQPRLRPITMPFDGYFEQTLRVSSTCLVSYDRNRYSVPAEHAGQRISLRANANRIRVVADSKLIAEHARHFGRERLILDPWHYLSVLEKKPGALRNGAPFQDWALPAAIGAVKDKLLKSPQGDRAFVEVLLAMRQYGADMVTVACELALEEGIVTTPVILNHMHRLLSPAKPEPITVSTALALAIEPAANCGRYDSLRGGVPCWLN